MGIEKGKLEGRLEGESKGINAMLELKFGEEGIKLAQRMNHSYSNFDTIKDAIKQAKTISELNKLLFK